MLFVFGRMRWNYTHVLFISVAIMMCKQGWSWMVRPRGPTSPLRPSDLWSTKISPFPLSTCTASPGYARCPRAAAYCLWVSTILHTHFHKFIQFWALMFCFDDMQNCQTSGKRRKREAENVFTNATVTSHVITVGKQSSGEYSGLEEKETFSSVGFL